jgi:hypothetical protein
VHVCQCAERTRYPKSGHFCCESCKSCSTALKYSQLHRLIERASTHLLGMTSVGDPETSFERFSPPQDRAALVTLPTNAFSPTISRAPPVARMLGGPRDPCSRQNCQLKSQFWILTSSKRPCQHKKNAPVRAFMAASTGEHCGKIVPQRSGNNFLYYI